MSCGQSFPKQNKPNTTTQKRPTAFNKNFLFTPPQHFSSSLSLLRMGQDSSFPPPSLRPSPSPSPSPFPSPALPSPTAPSPSPLPSTLTSPTPSSSPSLSSLSLAPSTSSPPPTSSLPHTTPETMEEEEGGGVEHPAREYVMRKLEEGGGGADRLEYGLKPTECNCKSTKCLKLYCECFLQSRFCGRYCLCRDCGNTPDKIEEIRTAVSRIVKRNPKAFLPTISHHISPTKKRNTSGCKCQKTACQKRYCPCFQSGVACDSYCRCVGCQNTPSSLELALREQEERREIARLEVEERKRKLEEEERGGVRGGGEMEWLQKVSSAPIPSPMGNSLAPSPTLFSSSSPSSFFAPSPHPHSLYTPSTPLPVRPPTSPTSNPQSLSLSTSPTLPRSRNGMSVNISVNHMPVNNNSLKVHGESVTTSVGARMTELSSVLKKSTLAPNQETGNGSPFAPTSLTPTPAPSTNLTPPTAPIIPTIIPSLPPSPLGFPALSPLSSVPFPLSFPPPSLPPSATSPHPLPPITPTQDTSHSPFPPAALRRPTPPHPYSVSPTAPSPPLAFSPSFSPPNSTYIRAHRRPPPGDPLSKSPPLTHSPPPTHPPRPRPLISTFSAPNMNIYQNTSTFSSSSSSSPYPLPQGPSPTLGRHHRSPPHIFPYRKLDEDGDQVM